MNVRLLGHGVWLALLVLILLPREARACGCVANPSVYIGGEPTPEVRLRDSVGQSIATVDVVFMGETVSADVFAATFRVDAIWKGTLRERLTIKSGAKRLENGAVESSSCDRIFAAATKYVVFAHQLRDGEVVTTSCTPAYTTDRAADVVAALDALASRRKPTPDNR